MTREEITAQTVAARLAMGLSGQQIADPNRQTSGVVDRGTTRARLGITVAGSGVRVRR